MAKPLVPDELWTIIEPMLPEWRPSPRGRQPRLDDRKALTGILFVLKTGIPWEDLPQEIRVDGQRRVEPPAAQQLEGRPREQVEIGGERPIREIIDNLQARVDYRFQQRFLAIKHRMLRCL